MKSRNDYSVSDLRFPIIAITQSGAITVHVNRNTLEVGHTKMLRRGWYREMTLIDSNGESYKVAKYSPVRGEGTFWGFSLIYSRRVRIELTLNSHQTLSLAEVKRTVCDGMTRDPHMWEASLYENGVEEWQRYWRPRALNRYSIYSD